jgi:hypothetical protein
MIPIPSGVRVWIATGHTDMRRGMNSLALLVQEAFKRNPHAGDLYVFRGKSGKLIKILWHDGLGMSLYAKRLGATFPPICRAGGLFTRCRPRARAAAAASSARSGRTSPRGSMSSRGNGS